MAKKKPTAADAIQDNGASQKKPRAKKVIDHHEQDAEWFGDGVWNNSDGATNPQGNTQNTSIAPIPTEGTTNQDETAGSTTADRIAEDTTQTEPDASANEKGNSGEEGGRTPQATKLPNANEEGNVASSVAETVAVYVDSAAANGPIAHAKAGETQGMCWERLRKEARAVGMPRGQGPGTAYEWATRETNRLFPAAEPPEPVIVEELPAAEPPAMSTIVDIPEEPAIEAAPPAPVADLGVSGLGDLPESWGMLPSNAQLQVEIAWVSANRLRVRSGSGVDLSRALSPAPSYSALSWLETSILFPSKFADISVKATAQQDDEREGIRREKLAIEEIRGLLAEMLG